LSQKADLRQKLIDAIQKFRVLRFVGGSYPPPANRKLEAVSAGKDIAAFGPDAVLAIIEIDTFRGHFVAQGQVGVLGALEDALRMRQEMDISD